MYYLKYLTLIILLILSSCTKSTDQVKTSINSASGEAIKQKILSFSKNVDSLSRESIKQESLIYTLGDYSFYVSRYLKDSQISLYIEHGHRLGYGEIENRYYLKEGKVVLFIHDIYRSKDELVFKTVRTFYQNGEVLFSDQKTAKTKEGLAKINYQTNDTPYANVAGDMQKLNDAIYQRGRFDLILEGITQYPKAQYLILSQNIFNAYRAALLIEKKDILIDLITNNPDKYRGRKLKVRWNIKDKNQAVYVSGSLAD